jgi:hypothetical protein
MNANKNEEPLKVTIIRRMWFFGQQMGMKANKFILKMAFEAVPLYPLRFAFIRVNLWLHFSLFAFI